MFQRLQACAQKKFQVSLGILFIASVNGGEYMTDVGEVYLCEICGNKVKVLESGGGTLVCCGEPMKLVA